MKAKKKHKLKLQIAELQQHLAATQSLVHDLATRNELLLRDFTDVVKELAHNGALLRETRAALREYVTGPAGWEPKTIMSSGQHGGAIGSHCMSLSGKPYEGVSSVSNVAIGIGGYKDDRATYPNLCKLLNES